MIFLKWFFEKINYVFSRATRSDKPKSLPAKTSNICPPETGITSAAPDEFPILSQKQNDQSLVGHKPVSVADFSQNNTGGTSPKPTIDNGNSDNGPSQTSPGSSFVEDNKKPGNPQIAGGRQWGAELYEFFFEHLLSIKNFDPNGLTEKLTLAWLTPTASRLRKSGGKCWGPYGLFINQYGSKEAFYYACVMEAGANLIALSLGTLVLRPTWWALYLILFLMGTCLILLSMPQIDFWDVDCEINVKPETWAMRLKKYKDVCHTLNKNKTWAALNDTQPLDTDIVSYPYVKRKEGSFIELENPEWPVVARRRKVDLIASCLSGLIPINKVSMGKLFPHRNTKFRFSFRAFRDDVLLLNDAREHNGQCEFFISFAFLAPRSIKARKLDGGFWGPLHTARRPFVSSGGLLREVILSAFLWLSSIGLGLLYYTYHLGLVYWVVSSCFIGLGLIGALGIKNSVEDWYDDDLWGGVPPAYPTRVGNRARKYKIYNDKIRVPGLNSGFVLHVLYFSNFF
jgi:hypothetical protein